MSSSRYTKIARAGLLGVAATLWGLSGCESNPSTTRPTADSKPTTRPVLASQKGAAAKGYAQLWSETCNRCHNAWSPDQLNAAQWDVVMRHMRVRASLSETEHKKILQFLQSSR